MSYKHNDGLFKLGCFLKICLETTLESIALLSGVFFQTNLKNLSKLCTFTNFEVFFPFLDFNLTKLLDLGPVHMREGAPR